MKQTLLLGTTSTLTNRSSRELNRSSGILAFSLVLEFSIFSDCVFLGVSRDSQGYSFVFSTSSVPCYSVSLIDFKKKKELQVLERIF